MSLITLMVALMVIGMIVYLEETYLPIAAPFKLIIRVVVVVVVILWLAQIFLGPIMVPRLR